jgi:hypothetical protein
MKRVARSHPPAPIPPPAGLREVELCRVSYGQPVQSCPTYIEYFKEGDDVPSQLCQVHRGTLKQRAARAVQGFLRGLGGKIRDIFR